MYFYRTGNSERFLLKCIFSDSIEAEFGVIEGRKDNLNYYKAGYASQDLRQSTDSQLSSSC